MQKERKQSRSIKIRPSLLKKAHLIAVQRDVNLSDWIEEAIEKKIKEEKRLK